MPKKSHRGAVQRRTENFKEKNGDGPPATLRRLRDARRRRPEANGCFKKISLRFLSVLMVILVILGGFTYYLHVKANRERLYTPLTSPLITDVTNSVTEENARRLWGTYRPHTYFGMKIRKSNSPVVGLMWMGQNLGEGTKPLRHWCDQHDGILTYGWMMHDGCNFGIQQIQDRFVYIANNFLKKPGGEHGGDWTAEFQALPLKGGEKIVVSLFIYMALDGDGEIQPIVAHTPKGDHLEQIKGHSQDLGNFEISFKELNFSKSSIYKFNYLETHARSLAELTAIVERRMQAFAWPSEDTVAVQSYGGLPGRVIRGEDKPNFIVYQITASLPIHLQVLFESESAKNSRAATLEGPYYQQEMQKMMIQFDQKLEEKFNLAAKGIDGPQKQLARVALSNMLGTLGYFYGQSLIQSDDFKDEVMQYWSAPLFTAVPSRSFFPRGFLWDEGFHDLLIEKWDLFMATEIIAHWLDLLNGDGWIPREQILGHEARQKVPPEFIIQHTENANPPTLFLPLLNVVERLSARKDPVARKFLSSLFPRLEVWYQWFNTTQTGKKPTTYRWRGRNPDTIKEVNPKTLTSGMDDYPRASHPTDNEYHLDLRCWMALASEVMVKIGESLNLPVEKYKATYETLTDNNLLDEVHWSSARKRYSDYGLHTDSIRLERPKIQPKPGQKPPPPQQLEKIRVVKKDPVYDFVDSYFGYNSLFPLLMQILKPTSIKLAILLEQIQDENLLWTPYGLRSLARSSPLYNKYNTEHDPPYWRGNIWINMNYLALRALHHYGETEGPYQAVAKEVYAKLRSNIINNMNEQFKKSGYLYENYNDTNGQGQGCHPFTGWSSLVLAIMSEQY